MRLTELGWNDDVARDFAPWASSPAVVPARVAIEFNHIFRLYAEGGEFDAVVSGRMKHEAARRSELPAVGDWVVVRRRPDEQRGKILALLPRRSKFSRKVAGSVTDEQVVAANVDVVFVVMGLDNDFNLRRLERYALLARESGAAPVILLTKPDLCSDVPARLSEVELMAGGLPVHVLSPRLNEGLEPVAGYLAPGRTGALLGSSGVGKSTIINRLAGGEVQKTTAVRESDQKGRHTTTHRELVRLPDRGLIVDTPGMRELQLWEVGGAVRETFDDLAALAAACSFSDCRHREEPRCAVKAAVVEGSVPAERLASYLKLQDEIAYLARQQDQRARLEDKRKAKLGSLALRARLQQKKR